MTHAEVLERLAHPSSPSGKLIQWTHPVLIFLAENGIMSPDEKSEIKAAETINRIAAYYNKPL